MAGRKYKKDEGQEQKFIEATNIVVDYHGSKLMATYFGTTYALTTVATTMDGRVYYFVYRSKRVTFLWKTEHDTTARRQDSQVKRKGLLLTAAECSSLTDSSGKAIYDKLRKL